MQNTKVRRARVPLYSDEPQTLGELFRQAVKKHNRPDVLNFKKNGKWQSISSDQMLARMIDIAHGLVALGLQRDDKAAILAANSPEWTMTDAACQLAGVVDVPIYTTLPENSVAYILNDSGSRVLFLEDAATLTRLRPILPECKTISQIVLFDASGVSDDDVIALSELERRGAELRASRDGILEEIATAIKPDDIATLIYTSGTTGEPKGVMLSHMNLISNVIDAGEKYSFSEKDTPLSVLPLSHVFERCGMYLYIFNGMNVHFAESIEKVPDNLQEVRPTIFVGVPRIFEKVYAKAKLKAVNSSSIEQKIFDWAIDTAKRVARLNEERNPVPILTGISHALADKLVYTKMRDIFGGRLRFCVTGGAALSDEISLIFTGAGISIMQGYGLTETSPAISSNNPIDARLGSVGKPLRSNTVRIAADGEIEVSGPGVMHGYYNKPDATNDVFTADGFFKTGDIGEIDKDGFLRITDRKKELFKTSGGKYIAPSPIEQMIKGSRFVSQVVLVGNERKFAAALIVPSFDQIESYARSAGIEDQDPAVLCSHPKIIELFEREVERLTTGLARYETVKRIALLERELSIDGGELTPTLKVKRRVVDEKYRDIIEQLYKE